MQRLQRSQKKGAKLPPNTKCVNRPTKWGNPFVVIEIKADNYFRVVVNEVHRVKKSICIDILTVFGTDGFNTRIGAANHAAKLFGVLMDAWPKYYDLSEFKRVKNIACYCGVGDPCHGDEIIIRLNRLKAHTSIAIKPKWRDALHDTILKMFKVHPSPAQIDRILEAIKSDH